MVALLLNWAVVSLAVSFLAVCAFLTLVLPLVHGGASGNATADPPRWDIPVRMVAALVMVLTLTWIAPWLGPRLSGLLTPFPVAATVLAAFTHRAAGHGAAGQLLRGLVAGLYTFAVFFLVVAGMLETYGVAPAFGAAMLAAVAVHWSSLVRLTTARR